MKNKECALEALRNCKGLGRYKPFVVTTGAPHCAIGVIADACGYTGPRNGSLDVYTWLQIEMECETSRIFSQNDTFKGTAKKTQRLYDRYRGGNVNDFEPELWDLINQGRQTAYFDATMKSVAEIMSNVSNLLIHVQTLVISTPAPDHEATLLLTEQVRRMSDQATHIAALASSMYAPTEHSAEVDVAISNLLSRQEIAT